MRDHLDNADAGYIQDFLDCAPYGVYSVAEYLELVREDLFALDQGCYYAAWMLPSGEIIAVPRHAILGCEYSMNFEIGLVRLCLCPRVQQRPDQPMQFRTLEWAFGREKITQAQMLAMLALYRGMQPERGGVWNTGSGSPFRDPQGWNHGYYKTLGEFAAVLQMGVEMPADKIPTNKEMQHV